MNLPGQEARQRNNSSSHNNSFQILCDDVAISMVIVCDDMDNSRLDSCLWSNLSALMLDIVQIHDCRTGPYHMCNPT